VKAPCSIQLRHDSRRHLTLRQAPDRCPMTASMTSSRCQLTWCDKVADSSFCNRASFWDHRRPHVTAKRDADSPPSLFATPTSGGFLGTTAVAAPHLRTPTYDFVFDIDMAQSRGHFRSPYCPPSCYVTTDDARSTPPSPTEEIIRFPAARAHRYVEGNVDDVERQTEVSPVNRN